MFNSVLINNTDGTYAAEYTELNDDVLPAGDVTINVEYSSINYKDALAITGKGPIVRSFPMIPGIDLAGTVTHSDSPTFQQGDAVLLTGWGVGERYWGGLAQKARVKSEWLTALPSGSNSRQVMAIGTAGFTAMLCVDAIVEHGVKPSDGPVLVTGASGGVGSCAVIILAALGYQVIASTGRPEENARLFKVMGASEIIDRNQLNLPGKPLQKERWVAAIDTVGSHTLCNVCAGTKYAGIVAACGMAQGMDLMGSVAPFILRGVTLKGIDSVMVDAAKRPQIWQKACEYLPVTKLEKMSTVLPLSQAIEAAHLLLDGKVSGRVVIDCNV